METGTLLQEKLKNLPDNPGVYLMKNAEGTIIYVGKAVVLKNRVRQYFQNGRKWDKVAAMVSEVADLDYIITDSEKEALILECNLIKKYRPHYNIMLKDDKHYPYVRIDTSEDFPRVEVVRSIKNDGARYFGPYLAAYPVRDILDALSKVFPLRQCKKDIARAAKRGERPCLNFDMKRCLAPCTGKVAKEEYSEILAEVMDFLSGKYEQLVKTMEEAMRQASENLEYEKCAILRDRIRTIREVSQRQKASFPDLNDKDVFALVKDDGEAVVQALFIRAGKMEYSERFYLVFEDETDGELIAHAIKQYYIDTPNVPKQIFVPEELPETELIEAWLTEKRGNRVYISAPKIGDNKKLVKLAELNAAEALNRKLVVRKREYERTFGACARLAEALKIPPIHRMECYDISNIQGTDSVGSMVVFQDGKPENKEYRRFKIKTVEGSDDFASMAEIVERRFKRALTEAREKEDDGAEGGFTKLPQLIVIDGGKGQLHAAYDALVSLGMEDIPIIGLAKREEEVFLPFEKEPLILSKQSDELKLLQRIRDEAHRFAITFHRSLREKRVGKSALDAVPGIGDKRKKALLKHFKSMERIKNAGEEELAAVEGIDRKSARAVYEYFNTIK
jgi:excinuclease ABC subunit C